MSEVEAKSALITVTPIDLSTLSELGVVPRYPAENLFDLPPEDLAATIVTTQRVAAAVKQAFDAPGVMIAQLSGAAAGQTVFHLHFHIIPRTEGEKLRPPASEMEKPEVLMANAEKIRAALG